MSFTQQRRSQLIALATLLLGGGTGAAARPSFPTRPITLLVGASPGGSIDIMARIVAGPMANRLGVPVNVENRPGATGSIAAAHVARSPADGHALLFAGAGFSISPALMPLNYDALQDFEPVGMVATLPNVLVVHPSVPARTVSELIALAKARPNDLSFASSGHASINRMAAELFQERAGVQMLHVPYKGSGEAIKDLLAGRVQLAFDNSPVLPHVSSGKLRALAVTSAQRTAQLPDVPTIAESGLPGYLVISWFGLLAPARTPDEVQALLSRELHAVLQLPEVRAAIIRAGAEPHASTGEELGEFLRSDIRKWTEIVKAKGIKLE